MTKPRLLDTFSCAGGAGQGYAPAGFDVYGVDIDPQPHYPFWFHQGDALEVMDALLAGEAVIFRRGLEHRTMRLEDFDAAHGSPPCQAFSTTKHTHAVDHPDLLDPTRERLIAMGLPYVIENVEGAPLIDPLKLCGTEFGLSAPDVDGVPLVMRRHRLFESNVWLVGAGGCDHDPNTIVGGSYKGVYARFTKPEGRDDPARKGGYTPALPVRAALLGIDWRMNEHELAQAIPPVYTEFIGFQLMEALKEAAA